MSWDRIHKRRGPAVQVSLVFNLEYPGPLFAFYLFLERCVFGIDVTSNVPACVREMDSSLTAIASSA